MPPNANQWRKQRFIYANHPRESVSWYQAVAFCRWLSHHLNLEIRLPHEEEWEVAARYPDGRSFPWGNKWDSSYANTNESGLEQTTAVGLYPNGQHPELGLYDLSGNLWEWCQNKYIDPKDASVDASGPRRSLRGGSFLDFRDYARADARFNANPVNHNYYLGLRVVVYRS